ncbi:uncharacterized protein LY89DRAFT_130628 [Mollisia scopiformis]|uniref:Uncharacterized protein n=1 Tax=Mollisia scopiformis TaxID=149040 RepID=A0A194X2C3_MOLSC|nr:uncharacterized protein LY89DRAFT_130628 [Mollisia scopiformis]KUJ14154.1 hypothetical protein LY89DRAFT_130628 [Mollisia scopiformis]
MERQPLHNVEPLKCWHCDWPNSMYSEFSVACNGWTLPTRIQELETEVRIEWEKFVIPANYPEEAKSRLMRDAMVAIANNRNVAILGVQFKRSRAHLGREKEKTAVFLYRAGGDKRLSSSSNKGHASSREWQSIKTDHDPVRLDFKEIVGKETQIVTYSYTLPEAFPKLKPLTTVGEGETDM